jgi:hypothetical protein
VRRSIPSAKRWVVGVAGAACVLSAVGVSACAALLGADFGDESLAGSPDAQPPLDVFAPTIEGGTRDSGIRGLDASLADGNLCPTGLAACGNACVDTTTNPSHCGNCATACPNDENGAGVCVKSRCTFACNQGWIECAGGCCSSTGDDAGSGADAAGGDDASAIDGGIPCETTFCPVASNSFCCGGGGAGGPDFCDTNVNDNCAVEIFCANAAQCQGAGACCYDNQAAGTVCQTQCNGNQVQLCDPQAVGECPVGTQCTGTFTPAGTTYASCQ